ncbi:uncharacterized protein [Penaeus vannamei]|uniref:uncharacterized protein n=1 Tax=Penaeus vannamei TaxID=6689 RepID=UPI00387F39D3
MECGNNRGIKLMSHSMKLYERVQESRLRNIVEISEEQFGFMKGKSTTDAIFVLRQFQGKFREGQEDLHSMFIDLEKAYGRVPREELYWCRQIREYPRSTLEWSKTYCRKKAPWDMMFADDVVLCAKEKRELKDLEQGGDTLERRGMKISRSKTEYMCLNGTSTGSVEMLQRQLPETMYTIALKGRIHMMVIQWEKVPLSTRNTKRLEVAEMKMCRWGCGHTLKDHVRNEVIREKLGITHITEQFRKARLKWFGHVKRKDEEYAERRVLEITPPVGVNHLFKELLRVGVSAHRYGWCVGDRRGEPGRGSPVG